MESLTVSVRQTPLGFDGKVTESDTENGNKLRLNQATSIVAIKIWLHRLLICLMNQ